MRSLKRIDRRIAGLACVLTLIQACSSTIRVPQVDMDTRSRDPDGRYRIEMKDGSEYRFTRYTTTDSTLVIQALHPDDERFETASLPVTLRRADVEYMTSTGKSWKPVLIVAGLAAVIGIVAWHAFGDALDDTD